MPPATSRVPDPGPVFTSRNLPPDVGAQRFNEIARTLPGAWKWGRAWVVPVAIWHAARSNGGR